MKKITKTASVLLTVLFLFATGCHKSNERKDALKDFQQVNLVANNGNYGALRIDSSLMNAWGLTFTPNGIAWVNSQAGHVSEVYNKEGGVVRPAVNIPSPGGPVGGNPTGVVFNGSSDFVLSNGKPGIFIFVGVDGILSGWNPTAGANALLIKNDVATSSYTGLTLASNGGANFLYAADFRSGKIVVWDKNFAPVSMSFTDPNLPAGYSPFNIQVVGNWLVVLYAKVGQDGRDQPGEGEGFVSIFNTDGSFVKKFASRGQLNAPWGVTQAPASFFEDNDGDKDDAGDDKSDSLKSSKDGHNNQPTILIGNFGNGRINAYSLDGKFLGNLKAHGKTIAIDGLWALSFPPVTATTIDPNRLYFTAGPNHESDGLFGYIIKK